MAKSTYLDNLINGKLPILPNSSYLNRLWRDTTNITVIQATSSIFEILTNSTDILLVGDKFLTDLTENVRNNLVTDMSSNIFSLVTFDKRYLPISQKSSQFDSNRYKDNFSFEKFKELVNDLFLEYK